MDPLSQAALGASLSQSFTKDKTRQLSAMVIGALAGMAPDLDVFIRSDVDPMLFLEFHRQFSHSLIFIPFGALLCALVFHGVVGLLHSRSSASSKQSDRARLSFAQIYLFSFLGYATHGLLDACTSYGTQLFWPFSNERVAWNTVSIIDPLFTLPILFLCVFAALKQKPRYAQIAFIYAVLFLSLGLVQKHRAEMAMHELAYARGHQVEKSHVKPSFANRHLWKTIYEADGYYYVDAVKLLSGVEYFAGDSIKKLDIKRDFPWLPADSQQAKDVERFRWFSSDYLAVSKTDPNFIIDVRYSFIPNQIDPMWGVEVNKILVDEGELDAHVFYEMNNGLTAKTRKRFFEMLF